MILCGARDSPLSKAQFDEVQKQLSVSLSPLFFKTIGDRDRKTSLRTLGKTDFFTRELDEALLKKVIRVAVHSAKDLPEPLPEGLSLIALTKGIDPRDCLVIRSDENLSSVRAVATSSVSREDRVRALLPTAHFVDLRGTIQERLDRLTNREVDGVVVAEAALVRLRLRHLNRYFLPPPSTELQGQLAVVARSDDQEMRELFAPLNAKDPPSRTLYLGLDPPSDLQTIHYPVIRTVPISGIEGRVRAAWQKSTHLIFTSKRAVLHLPPNLSWEGKQVFAIGKGTASLLPRAVVAPYACQEGMVELLKQQDLRGSKLLWLRSKRSRSLLEQIPMEIIDLYDTVPHQPGFPPSLEEVDELFFTSPSCIDGFFRIYGMIPPQKRIRFQGKITKNALFKKTPSIWLSHSAL